MEKSTDELLNELKAKKTYEEFFEVLTLKQLGQHRKPIAFLNIDGYYDELFNAMEYSIETRFIKPECRALYKLFTDFEEMVDYLENDDMEGLTVQDLK